MIMRRIYRNGTIITMERGSAPEAVLVRDGYIEALGALSYCRSLAPEAEIKDLGGAALLPAFIDPHSHLTAAANARLQLDVSNCRSFADIENSIRAYVRENSPEPGAWIMARGYDQNSLAEHSHPPAELLRRAAPDNPVALQQVSGHMGVFSDAGYLEEGEYMQRLASLPGPDMAALLRAFRLEQRRYASYGIVTAQEGMITRELAQLYRLFMSTNAFELDVVGYVDFRDAEEVFALLGEPSKDYVNRFRIGGLKVFLDGSPQGRTAWLREPYEGETEYRSAGTMTDAELLAAVKLAASRKVQLLAHCNGDAACAQYLRVLRQAASEGADISAARPVLIHAQLLARDQLAAVRELGVTPSFFVAHVLHWGDVHLKNLGLRRAEHISCAASAMRAGIGFTFHQDTPVIAPDMLETVYAAVERKTASGVALGIDEGVPILRALRAVTLDAARQYGEDAVKGSIAPGKRADFVILSRDPLTTDPAELRSIEVRETIRAGERLFSGA